MAPFKKDLTPLSKGGQIIKHAGKGSSAGTMPDRTQVAGLAKPAGQSPNNYAKATPLANPQPTTVPDGLGSGSWPGIGQ